MVSRTSRPDGAMTTRALQNKQACKKGENNSNSEDEATITYLYRLLWSSVFSLLGAAALRELLGEERRRDDRSTGLSLSLLSLDLGKAGSGLTVMSEALLSVLALVTEL